MSRRRGAIDSETYEEFYQLSILSEIKINLFYDSNMIQTVQNIRKLTKHPDSDQPIQLQELEHLPFFDVSEEDNKLYQDLDYYEIDEEKKIKMINIVVIGDSINVMKWKVLGMDNHLKDSEQEYIDLEIRNEEINDNQVVLKYWFIAAAKTKYQQIIDLYIQSAQLMILMNDKCKYDNVCKKIRLSEICERCTYFTVQAEIKDNLKQYLLDV